LDATGGGAGRLARQFVCLRRFDVRAAGNALVAFFHFGYRLPSFCSIFPDRLISR